jgi:hypothetical protein
VCGWGEKSRKPAYRLHRLQALLLSEQGELLMRREEEEEDGMDGAMAMMGEERRNRVRRKTRTFSPSSI